MKLKAAPAARIPIAASFPVQLGTVVAGTVSQGDTIAAGVRGHGVRILLGAKH